MKKLLTILVVAVIFTACGERNSMLSARAHILERKITGDGKLMINYTFTTGQKAINDSLQVDTQKVIPHDSLTVLFSSKNPSNHHLQVP